MDKYNVLVADDEMITEAIELYLRNGEYNVFIAHDGIETLKIIDKKTIHLIIITKELSHKFVAALFNYS